ncbi:MAG: hypothetical protein JKY61_08745 [Planctomycetes bacterium]|nr:hypothetical protein [Planctomycetota bacterium]
MIALLLIAKIALTVSLAVVAKSDAVSGVDQRVDLSGVYAQPAEAVGRELSFYVQFDGLQEEWNPFGTGFAAQSHLRARVWSDSQRLWDRFDFSNPRGEVFVRLGTRAARTLVGAQRYQRLLCVGKVRNLRCGRPWIDVTRVYVARHSVSEGSLLHVIRGAELHARKAYSMARDEYARAITTDLPKAVRQDLRGFIEACYSK